MYLTILIKIFNRSYKRSFEKKKSKIFFKHALFQKKYIFHAFFFKFKRMIKYNILSQHILVNATPLYSDSVCYQ